MHACAIGRTPDSPSSLTVPTPNASHASANVLNRMDAIPIRSVPTSSGSNLPFQTALSRPAIREGLFRSVAPS